MGGVSFNFELNAGSGATTNSAENFRLSLFAAAAVGSGTGDVDFASIG
jgi:hypothetical protein